MSYPDLQEWLPPMQLVKLWAADGYEVELKEPRFALGARIQVILNVGRRHSALSFTLALGAPQANVRGCGWKRGVIVDRWYREEEWPVDMYVLGMNRQRAIALATTHHHHHTA